MGLEREFDLFVRAATGFAELVRRIEPRQWDGPGLGEWDLRALVGHTTRSLITVTEYVDRPVASVDLESPEAYYAAASAFAGADQAAVVERGRQAGEVLGADPAAVVAELRDAAVARLRGQPDLRMYTLLGGMWLRDYLPTRTFELAVHGLDIAAATGSVGHRPDPEVAGAMVAIAGRVAAERGDGGEVLRALTGRSVLAAGFSVV